MAALPKVLVTETPTLDHTVVAETPPGMSNVVLVVMPPAKRLFYRVARVYLVGVLGFLGGAFVPGVQTAIAPAEGWNQLAVALTSAIFPAVGALVLELVSLLSSLEETRPELRG